MRVKTLLDAESLRPFFAPNGEWARACGRRYATRRKAAGRTLEAQAELISSTAATISRIERGELVPRPHLMAASAFSLGCEVHDIWEMPSRSQLLRFSHAPAGAA